MNNDLTIEFKKKDLNLAERYKWKYNKQYI